MNFGSALRECLKRLLNFALPRNEHLRRVCDYKFLIDTRSSNESLLKNKLRYVLNHMTIRDIVCAYKKGFFSANDVYDVVCREVEKRGGDRIAITAPLLDSYRHRREREIRKRVLYRFISN